MSQPRILFVILDAFPFDRVSSSTTPTLWALAEEGGWSEKGGQSVLSASTYPNHASFVTGVGPEQHGVLASRAPVVGEWRPAREVPLAARTLFEDCRVANLRSVGLFGDQNLVQVCGALKADAHWPPQGQLPDSCARGLLGYGADQAVVEAATSMELKTADLVVVQLDEVDTVRHLRGPDAPESREQCTATDAALGELLEPLRSQWAETLVIVVSDHDMERVEPGAIDLNAEALARGLSVHVEHDGTACWVVGETTEEALLRLPSVEGVRWMSDRHWVVWGRPGQQYGTDFGLAGQHGSPRTARQLAVVGGGHSLARTLGSWIRRETPMGTAWAPTIRRCLGVVGQGA
ncbi:MAG: alkaline phosphatase family protein [Myxococcota bacterium]|nr:alkaline phosphatase family protein [Myxococcota bacterium]